ncbi:MAG: PH domain-containing protein [Actinobacteria bacterium]|nr:PH domain-containing protein [Actinomycetota bacterium]MCA1722597.1 PH domain-containing protein [Actinomycetota bacterium]
MTAGRVVFQRRSRWFLVALCLVAALVALSGVFVSDSGQPPSVGQRGVCLLLVAGLVTLAGRVARLGATLDDAGVRIRNIVRDVHLPWAVIVDVEPPQPYGTWRKAGPRIHTSTGRVVSAAAFGRGPMDGEDVGASLVAAIRERL